MTRIPLTGIRGDGRFATVDEAGGEAVAPYKWFIGNHGYAAARIEKQTVTMHRLLLGPGVGVVDHINRDKLDNRRTNLRRVPPGVNIANSGPRRSSASGVKGVRRSRGGRWHAQISLRGKLLFLGAFNTREEAAAAYAFVYSAEYGMQPPTKEA